MRAVLQRVSTASVSVNGMIVSEVGPGLLALIGIAQGDTDGDARLLADKIAALRCFADEDSKFNLSVRDVCGSVLAISQFTLLGDCRRGRRPSFSDAARPDEAEPLYEATLAYLRAQGIKVKGGFFGAHMAVHSVNDGPVTLLVDTRRAF